MLTGSETQARHVDSIRRSNLETIERGSDRQQACKHAPPTAIHNVLGNHDRGPMILGVFCRFFGLSAPRSPDVGQGYLRAIVELASQLPDPGLARRLHQTREGQRR